MRLLDKTRRASSSLERLGFGDDDLQAVPEDHQAARTASSSSPGPTGSGKTTTLYAALKELNRPDVKIITAEDPVEYHFAGINQCQVRHQIGLDFARILRAMLRQAPNIILVGEIRDKETAEIAIQAALTGHLVFSTLHTNDAPSALTRLIDMGVKPFLVSSAVMAVMAQRLCGCSARSASSRRPHGPDGSSRAPGLDRRAHRGPHDLPRDGLRRLQRHRATAAGSASSSCSRWTPSCARRRSGRSRRTGSASSRGRPAA